MSRKDRSEPLAEIHKTLQALKEFGEISKITVRSFDVALLTPVEPLSPERIKALREREGVSQAIFASYLNVTVSLVSKWERGEKKPSGAALKLLSLVERHGLLAIA